MRQSLFAPVRGYSPVTALLAPFFAAFAFAAALPGLAGASGCASAVFGVSANAVPHVRKIDSVSAASFFIASLFSKDSTQLTREIASPVRKEDRSCVLRLRQMIVNIL